LVATVPPVLLAGSGSVTIIRSPKASLVKVFHLPAGSVVVLLLPEYR
jgi:hypothetical protein